MLLSQVNQLSSIDKTHCSDMKINQLTSDLNQATTEIKKLKNKLFLKENDNNGSKTSLRNFRTNKSNADYIDESELGPRTPDQTSFDRKILENYNSRSNKFLNDKPTKLDASPYRLAVNQNFNNNRSMIIEQERDDSFPSNKVHRKSFDFYNFKPISILKNDNKN